MKTLLRAVVGAFVLASCNPADAPDEHTGRDAAGDAANVQEPEAVSITFTSALTADNNPVDDVTRISVNAPAVYLYVKWRNLEPERRYEVVYTVLDGAAAHVTSERALMTPTRPRWASWFGHEFRATGAARQTGTWTFEVTLDGVSRGRKKLLVAAEREPGG